jgi:hypothetical protein
VLHELVLQQEALQRQELQKPALQQAPQVVLQQQALLGLAQALQSSPLR